MFRLSFIQLAETVSHAMESQDPYTAGHQRRVAELAKTVGEKLGLGQDRLQGLYIAGLLHDIGKISIPAEILTHPGKLSDAEWTLIRTHPRRGYEILKQAKFPWPVADIALHHHEHLDGTGYPGGQWRERVNSPCLRFSGSLFRAKGRSRRMEASSTIPRLSMRALSCLRAL